MQEELTAIVAGVQENAPNIQTRAEFEAYQSYHFRPERLTHGCDEAHGESS
jgi:hypothetical protein